VRAAKKRTPQRGNLRKEIGRRRSHTGGVGVSTWLAQSMQKIPKRKSSSPVRRDAETPIFLKKESREKEKNQTVRGK